MKIIFVMAAIVALMPPPPLMDVPIQGSAPFVKHSHPSEEARPCVASVRIGCIHAFMLHCFDCGSKSTVGGCFDAWAGAYATAFGANEPLPFTHSEFLSEVQWLYRQLEPFDIYMHSDAS